MVTDALDAGLLGTMGAAVDLILVFDAVADHLAAAMGTGRRQCVNGALEGIVGVIPAGQSDVNALS
jgi:hypothetical protein